jgi:hypothetical protein
VAKTPRSNPYPAHCVQHGEVHCGHNPWLRARRVQNVRVVRRADGTHKLEWDELPARKAPGAKA